MIDLRYFIRILPPGSMGLPQTTSAKIWTYPDIAFSEDITLNIPATNDLAFDTKFTGSLSNGGGISIVSGNGVTSGGSIAMQSGSASNGDSGSVELSTGDAVSSSGNLLLATGNSADGSSGDITLSQMQK